MRSFEKTSAGEIWGWYRSGEVRLGNDGPTPEREGGISGHWAGRVFAEGVLSSGEFSLEKECRVARRTPWVQIGAGDCYGYFGGQAGTADGQACTQAPLPGLPGCPKYV